MTKRKTQGDDVRKANRRISRPADASGWPNRAQRLLRVDTLPEGTRLATDSDSEESETEEVLENATGSERKQSGS